MKEECILSKVKILLEERGWSLYRLAKESDLSYSTLKNLFQRNKSLTLPTLMRICNGLEITLSEFFAEEGDEVRRLNVSDQKLLADFHRLRKNEKQLVMDRILYGFND